MPGKLQIKKWVFFVAIGALLFVAIGFAGKRQWDKPFNTLYVDIDYSTGHYFLHENDIHQLIKVPGEEVLAGSFAGDVNLRSIENKIEKHPFVKSAEVFRDLKGNVKARVYQKKPVARILNNGGFGAYITDEGEVVPLSGNYTARVVLVRIPSSQHYKGRIDQDEKGQGLFRLITWLEKNSFWKAQIAEIAMDGDGELTLYPQVSKQYIEFGKPDDIEKKFNKLRIFYTRILPEKGWNSYARVNLKFKDQIVCE